MITFIIPTVNRPSLKRAIDSLYAQTLSEWKAIIIYDGVEPSEDYSSDQIKILKINKTGILGEFHGQAGLVRNIGISQIDTEWVGFLDDDDVLDKHYVELLESKYSMFDLVIFRMNCSINNAIIPRFNNNALYDGNVGISFCYKPFSRDEVINFSENSTAEDYELVEGLIKSGYKYIISEEVAYYVRPE